MFSVVFTSTVDISNYTLIIPSVSVGNVGQLATDLIINTLSDVTKIGYIHSAYLHPLVGAEAFDGGIAGREPRTSAKRFGNLSLGCELFASVKHGLLLIQQRTPPIKGKSAAYRSELRKWIKEARIGNVIMLTSSFAHQRLDSQIDDPFCRFLCTSAVDAALLDKFQSELKWKVLERNDTLAGSNPSEDRVIIPGGGIATRFFQECMEDGIPLIILLKFCSEGDNMPDSVELASFLNSWLRITTSPKVSETTSTSLQSEWKFPASWQLMFGSGPPSTIF